MIYNKMVYDLYKKKNLKINQDLYYNNRSDDLVKYIIDVFKAYERIPNIKIAGWEHITDESKIDPYVINQKHAKTKITYKKYLPIDDTRYELLKVFFNVDTEDRVLKYEVNLLLPKRYKNFYFLLNGNKFYPIYQLVDSSTFSRKNSIILRPMNIYREKIEMADVNGELYDGIKYNLLIFGKKLNPLLLYTSVMGISNTLKYMFLNDIIRVTDVCENKEDMIYFKSKQGLYVEVVKYFYIKDKFTQSIVSNLIGILNDSRLDDLDIIDDRDIWGELLGSNFTTAKEPDKKISKAKEIINSFYAIATNLYKSNLKLKRYNKDNTFAILRWILQNFTQLRLKDSLDLKNKRIRLPEYIADYFSQVVNTKLNRFLSNGTSQVATKDLKYLFQFPQNTIIKKLMYTKTPLLRYDNSVNDMDFFTAFKYSIKGPSGVSATGRTSVSLMAIHPSQVGRIDLTSSSSSDPGVTGYFTPFCKTIDGKFFDTTEEPQNWLKRFMALYSNYYAGTSYDIDPLDLYEDMVVDNNKLLKKVHDVQSFVENYTGSNKKLKIIDLKRTKKNKIAVIEKENPKKCKKYDKPKNIFRKEKPIFRKVNKDVQ